MSTGEPAANTSGQSLFTTRKDLRSDRPSEGKERNFRLNGLLDPWFDKKLAVGRERHAYRFNP
jgi:hypothetical protein